MASNDGKHLSQMTSDLEECENATYAIPKAFGLAMSGDARMMEDVVEHTLKQWAAAKDPDIILMALKLMKVSHARRGDLVLKFLDVIFETEGDFEILFHEGICGLPTQEELDIFEWVLSIGSRKIYKSQNGTIPMVDVPSDGHTLAAYAALRNRPGVLLLFLRYGADPFKAAQYLRPIDPSCETSGFGVSKSEMIYTLILRASPHPPPEILSVVPCLAMVPRLKHMCKIVIRSELSSMGMLPSGISDLPIPVVLKEYVDLLRD